MYITIIYDFVFLEITSILCPVLKIFCLFVHACLYLFIHLQLSVLFEGELNID